jgi:hypothetical protein
VMHKGLSSIKLICIRIVVGVAILLTLVLVADAHPVSSAPYKQTRQFQKGDILVSIGFGRVQWRDPSGNLIQTLDTQSKAQNAGLVFNTTDKNLYVADFNARNVSVLDSTGSLIGSFGFGYSDWPESILFDRAGNAYIGEASLESQINGNGTILEFDATGNPISQFTVAAERRGADWIDLASDQCTIYYTSEGISIKRYDVCTNQQLPDFATDLPGGIAYALRLLPGGGLLVADAQQTLRLDNTGKIVQAYDAPNQDSWFALNLDPDGTSFWSADQKTRDVFKFNIDTGNQILTFNAGDVNGIDGLAIVGEIILAQSTPTPVPVIPTSLPPTPIPPAPALPVSLIAVLIGGLFVGGTLLVGTIVLIARAAQPPKYKTGHQAKMRVQPYEDAAGQQTVEPASTKPTPAIRLGSVQGQADYFFKAEDSEEHKEE